MIINGRIKVTRQSVPKRTNRGNEEQQKVKRRELDIVIMILSRGSLRRRLK